MVKEQQWNFESIRPYEDHEVQKVFNRLKNEKYFLRLIGFLYPEIPPEKFMEKLMHIKTIRQFQEEVVSEYVKGVLKNTTKGVTVEGLNNLDANESYLFISNHRDIVLDPAILNILLFENGFNTTEIAIGDNLLIYPWITDLVKLNRTFIVRRNVPFKQMMESSILLSSYIRFSLNQKKHSIWLAQREGRSKDGNDRTQVSLLKMLNISGEKNIIENFKELRMVPVSISYEYDPCDYLKAVEFQTKKENPDYSKTKDDDLLHMSTGLQGRKGRVHFAFGKPLEEEFNPIDAISVKNDKYNALAEIIDNHVHLNYKLYPGNYIAWDLLNDQEKFSDKYSEEEKQAYIKYVEDRVKMSGNKNPEFIYDSILEMYANPLINQLSYKVDATSKQ